MATVEALSASLEDYLEAIYHLVQAHRVARVKDIAARLDVQMPSVTTALRALAARDLVHHDPYSYVTLTQEGEEVAREVVRRHEVLTHFLADFLGVERSVADRNACHLEHAIEPVVLERLVGFIDFAERCPRAEVKWMHGSACFCGEGDEPRSCEACVARCLEALRSRREEGEASP
ncbi:MAG: metal-dependent transcriptional regulator [Candidatus Brocadiia bacterium]